MCFNVGDAIRSQIGLGQRRADHSLLGQGIGSSNAGSAAVLIDGTRTQDSEDVVTITSGIGQTFEEEHSATFAPHITIGASVKRTAASIRR